MSDSSSSGGTGLPPGITPTPTPTPGTGPTTTPTPKPPNPLPDLGPDKPAPEPEVLKPKGQAEEEEKKPAPPEPPKPKDPRDPTQVDAGDDKMLAILNTALRINEMDKLDVVKGLGTMAWEGAKGVVESVKKVGDTLDKIDDKLNNMFGSDEPKSDQAKSPASKTPVPKPTGADLEPDSPKKGAESPKKGADGAEPKSGKSSYSDAGPKSPSPTAMIAASDDTGKKHNEKVPGATPTPEPSPEKKTTPGMKGV